MENLEEFIKEAKLCLNCKNPMCRKGCPIETNIPQFIQKIKENKLNEAYDILQENNIMSDICSTVCPYEETCEGNCIKGIKGNSIKINKLERFVNLWARENNYEYKSKIEKTNNYKVAIIGSGPAGIACAMELAKKGCSVTIFERENQIGGLLTYGIPGFRLPRNITENLRKKIEELGIEIKTGKELGKNIHLKELIEKKYGAIFLAIGSDISLEYKLSDKEYDNIYKSDYILREYNSKRKIKDLGDVIVIGGGNVATDAARAVLRMGAKSSTILYRRNKEKMPARKIELEEAITDGVKIKYNTVVKEVEGKDNKLNKIKCKKTNLQDNKLIEIENSEFYVEANTVVFAIGLKPDKSLLEKEKIKINENGLIEINNYGMTNIKGVFAGGDVTQTKGTVCKAIKDGKQIAKKICNFLDGLFYPPD